MFVCRWNTYVVDGHDVEELCKAFWQAKQVKGKPTCIVAKTFKGKGLKSEYIYDQFLGLEIYLKIYDHEAM